MKKFFDYLVLGLFEINFISSKNRSAMPENPNYDGMSTKRNAGGAHTHLPPVKRVIVFKHASNQNLPMTHEEQAAAAAPQVVESNYYSSSRLNHVPVSSQQTSNPRSTRHEVSILGQDGHVYKGRLNSRLAVAINKQPVMRSLAGQRVPNAFSLDQLAFSNNSNNAETTSSFLNEQAVVQERKETNLPSLNSNL
jgi:hypothetical protein